MMDRTSTTDVFNECEDIIGRIQSILTEWPEDEETEIDSLQTIDKVLTEMLFEIAVARGRTNIRFWNRYRDDLWKDR